MALNKSIDLNGLDLAEGPRCDCGCEKCHTNIKLLKEKIILIYNMQDRKLTRQSLNQSFNNSYSMSPKAKTVTKSKGCTCKKGCSSRCGCLKKSVACSSHCKCGPNCTNSVENNLKNNEPTAKLQVFEHENKPKSFQLQVQDENFDPMKPRHQLPRSPVLEKRNSSSILSFKPNDLDLNSTPLSNASNVSLANASIKSMASDLPEELQKPIIDWEKHKAELVPCLKCNRKFLPIRLDKHMNVCKKT